MPKRKKGGRSPGLKKLAETLTRVHEAGHVVAAWFDPYLPKIKKVTVEPGEDYLGYAQIKWKDHHDQLVGIDEARALIRFCLGGRTAEKLCGGPKMYGAGTDLINANMLAHFMVMGFGLSKEFGHTLPVFLAMGERTKQLADDAIMTIMRECSEETEKLLHRKKPQILAVAYALQRRDTLKTKHLEKILGPRPDRKIAAILPPKKKTARRR